MMSFITEMSDRSKLLTVGAIGFVAGVVTTEMVHKVSNKFTKVIFSKDYTHDADDDIEDNNESSDIPNGDECNVGEVIIDDSDIEI